MYQADGQGYLPGGWGDRLSREREDGLVGREAGGGPMTSSQAACEVPLEFSGENNPVLKETLRIGEIFVDSLEEYFGYDNLRWRPAAILNFHNSYNY